MCWSLNKVDLISEAQKEKLMAILRSLNPRARIVVSRFGQVPLGNILIPGCLISSRPLQAPAGLKNSRANIRRRQKNMGSPALSFAQPAFHPTRFWQVMENELDESSDQKVTSGWPAVQNAGSWSQAGGIARRAGGMWWASVPKDVGQRMLSH